MRMPRPKPTSQKPFSSDSSGRRPASKRFGHSPSSSAARSENAGNWPADTHDVSLTTLISSALHERTFLKLVLSQPVSNLDSTISKVMVRPIDIGGDIKYQWTVRSKSQEFHDNLSADEFLTRTAATFGTALLDAHLFTSNADLTVRWTGGKALKIKRKPPTLLERTIEAHNREKQYLIPVGVPCPFLTEIGVMSPSGQVRPSMYHKFRQINRFLEFIEDVLPNLPATGSIRVVDFGCGKSSLTFALHHLLTNVHHREVQITGLDLKQDVIEDCSRIALALNCAGLRFQVGRIEAFQPETHVHLAVALHACDTATDDALAAAIRWNCEAILAVPCCQHEICQTLGRQTLAGLTDYGILKERFASLATDGLRARYLEMHGYKTQVLEFIETEHTPKNLLLRAIRRCDESNVDLQVRRAEYEQLKQTLGLDHWHLETAMLQK